MAGHLYFKNIDNTYSAAKIIRSEMCGVSKYVIFEAIQEICTVLSVFVRYKNLLFISLSETDSTYNNRSPSSTKNRSNRISRFYAALTFQVEWLKMTVAAEY